MSRLTNAITNLEKFYLNLPLGSDAIMPYDNYPVIISWLKELKAYQDVEEQGLLLRLPCKVGDKVYAISTSNDTSKVYECIVKFIKVDSSEEPYVVAHCTELNLGVTLYFSSFGKTVFLTKEEVEQKLFDNFIKENKEKIDEIVPKNPTISKDDEE